MYIQKSRLILKKKLEEILVYTFRNVMHKKLAANAFFLYLFGILTNSSAGNRLLV